MINGEEPEAHLKKDSDLLAKLENSLRVAVYPLDRVRLEEDIKQLQTAYEARLAQYDVLVRRQLEDVRVSYLKFVVDHCGRLEPRGIPQTVRSVTLPLDKVYVSLTAEREQERDREPLLPEPFDSDLRGRPTGAFAHG